MTCWKLIPKMRISRFFSLKREEKIIFFLSLYRVIYFRFLLSRIPFMHLIEKANKEICKKNVQGNQLSVSRISWAVRKASRFVPGATCLVQSLAGRVIFAREGYETKLKIGVVKEDGSDLQSHAWLLCQNDVVLGQLGDLEKFSIICDSPGESN